MRLNSIFRINLLSSVLPLLVVLLALGISWTFIEYREFEADTERIRAELMQAQEDMIRQQVDEVVEYLGHMESKTSERVRQTIKSRTEEAVAVAERLYAAYHGRMSDQELQELVREALRDIRFNSGRGYYFATRLDGVEMLFADHPELEGQNLLSAQDSQGRFVVQDMIRIAREQGQGFYEYGWTKPGVEGEDHAKIAYVQYFEPFDWLIGTGEYIEDMELEVQTEALNRIGNIRTGPDGYVFVLNLQGILLSHVDPDLQGDFILTMRDSQGTELFKDIIEAGLQEQGGVVEYLWPKPSTGVETPKMTYSLVFEPWNWIVCAGVFLDDVELSISQMRDRFWAGTRNKLLLAASAAVFAMGVWFLMVRHFSLRLRQGVDTFGDFFRKAVDSNEPVDDESLPFHEFKTMAGYANTMLEDRALAEEALVASEERFRSVVESSPMGMLFYALKQGDLILRGANQSAEDILGVPVLDRIGLSIEQAFPGMAEAEAPGLFREVIRTGEPFYGEQMYYTDEEIQGAYEFHAFRHTPNAVAVMFLDVTERIQAQEQINNSLAEKEVLLKEIHHRVKNNLQIISSLLYLQSEYVRDPNALDLFMESRNRIHAMAMVHEELYRSPDLARVDLKEYLLKLVPKLAGSYSQAQVESQVEAESVKITVEQAVPCGLIVSELVTNAVKHAFTGIENSKVTVRLFQRDDKVFIEVQDNGTGLPPGFDLYTSESLGLQLVVNLTKQLKGELASVGDRGALFTVSFPVQGVG
ncbi:MAG: PAS domain-containing protein [Desulfovibrio sp.]|nr:MAG: PAS domain-containing protein [Desulfovibrio sp.]